ncbi:hypothetical protein LXA43DRAFT_1143459 [Ganoderma leucocontextum]|nr:hypothetical protein LXA43DRAFT_1143459 [Ganoderma leucocontextum]
MYLDLEAGDWGVVGSEMDGCDKKEERGRGTGMNDSSSVPSACAKDNVKVGKPRELAHIECGGLTWSSPLPPHSHRRRPPHPTPPRPLPPRTASPTWPRTGSSRSGSASRWAHAAGRVSSVLEPLKSLSRSSALPTSPFSSRSCLKCTYHFVEGPSWTWTSSAQSHYERSDHHPLGLVKQSYSTWVLTSVNANTYADLPNIATVDWDPRSQTSDTSTPAPPSPPSSPALAGPSSLAAPIIPPSNFALLGRSSRAQFSRLIADSGGSLVQAPSISRKLLAPLPSSDRDDNWCEAEASRRYLFDHRNGRNRLSLIVSKDVLAVIPLFARSMSMSWILICDL